MQDIIIVCEDLFGLEVYSVLSDMNLWYSTRGEPVPYNILGYISDNENPFGHICTNIPRLGKINDWIPLSDERYVMGMKQPEQKKKTVEILKAKGCKFETIYTPWLLAPVIDIGEGSVVASYSIKAGMKLGRFVTVIGAMLTSRSVGDYSTVLRYSNITGNVGESSYVGNHVYTHLGKEIGDHCYVSDGSIVVNNVKSSTTVAGIPARKIKQ